MKMHHFIEFAHRTIEVSDLVWLEVTSEVQRGYEADGY